MMHRLSFGLICLGLVAMAEPVSAQTSVSGGLIPQSAARRYGLERAWFTQLQLDPGRSRPQDMRIFVSSKHAQTVFQVFADTGEKYRFTDRDLDIFGQPLGVAGAKKEATRKQDALKKLGIKATIQQRVVPDITLYVTTDEGLVQAIDAETGKTHWVNSVGNRNYPTLEPAVSEKYVVIVNGTVIYALDTRKGKILWHRDAGGIPATGGAILGDYVGVPMVTGELELYSLGEAAFHWPKLYYSFGQVFAPPTTAGNRMLWANASGQITAITPGESGEVFRLRTGVPIRGQITYLAPDQLFAVTETGYIYSFKASTGAILWRFSTGDKTTKAPIVIGDCVYVVTKFKGMFCINAQTGAENWWAKDISQFIAATNERVYGVTTGGRIAVLDRRTGGILGVIPTIVTDTIFTNAQTDRIYVASASGLVQCLHVVGADWPLIHVTLEAQTAPKKKPEKTTKPAPAVKPVDPFATGGTAPAPAPKAPAAKKPAPAAPAKKPAKSSPPADNPFG